VFGVIDSHVISMFHSDSSHRFLVIVAARHRSVHYKVRTFHRFLPVEGFLQFDVSVKIFDVPPADLVDRVQPIFINVYKRHRAPGRAFHRTEISRQREPKNRAPGPDNGNFQFGELVCLVKI
jgi:hypothetical protein